MTVDQLKILQKAFNNISKINSKSQQLLGCLFINDNHEIIITLYNSAIGDEILFTLIKYGKDQKPIDSKSFSNLNSAYDICFNKIWAN
jgi:hypothetical protein